MKTKSLLFALGLSLGCILNADSQTIYTQNFDAVPQNGLPTGWTSNTISTFDWYVDSSNFSTGYTGASGMKNAVIKDLDSAGNYVLTSAAVATTGYTNVTLIWASRVSTNFLTGGSSVPILSYSIDGGTTWTNVSYTDNAATSVWALVNGGTPISLPANANNQASLKLRWTVNIKHGTSGTYRIDDIVLQGTTAGVDEIFNDKTVSIYPNPATTNFSIDFTGQPISEQYILSVFDVTGKMIREIKCGQFPCSVSRENLESGYYFIRISDAKNTHAGSFKLLVQ